MEAWREELYRTQLAHHGIKGQQWGKRNGPPYPLDEDAHSANEEKMNWRESISGFIKKYGSGSGSGGDEKPEYEDDLDTKYKQATWHSKVDSRLNKVAKNFNVSKDELVNQYVKGSDSEKFLNLLNKSGVISDSEKERLSKSENKQELEGMRKTLIDQYDEAERRANEKAASKSSGSKGGRSSSGGKKASSPKKKEPAKKEEKKEDPNAPEKWEKPLYRHLSSMMSKNKWSYNDLIKNVVKAKGTDKNGKQYDELLAVLGESGAITKEEWKALSSDSKKLEDMRKKILKYFRGLRDYQSEIDSKKAPVKKKTNNDQSEIDSKKAPVKKKTNNKNGQLAHEGVSVKDGAPGRGSGRYPLGSGKNPRSPRNSFFKDSVYRTARKLSDVDLNAAIDRYKREQQYVAFRVNDITDGKHFVEGLIVRFGTKSCQKFVDEMASKTGVAAAGKLVESMKKTALPVINEVTKKKVEDKKESSKPDNNSADKNLQKSDDKKISKK